MPDTRNKQLVSVNGNSIVIMKMAARLSKEDALNLAAWLVALADDGSTPCSFAQVLEAVQNT